MSSPNPTKAPAEDEPKLSFKDRLRRGSNATTNSSSSPRLSASPKSPTPTNSSLMASPIGKPDTQPPSTVGSPDGKNLVAESEGKPKDNGKGEVLGDIPELAGNNNGNDKKKDVAENNSFRSDGSEGDRLNDTARSQRRYDPSNDLPPPVTSMTPESVHNFTVGSDGIRDVAEAMGTLDVRNGSLPPSPAQQRAVAPGTILSDEVPHELSESVSGTGTGCSTPTPMAGRRAEKILSPSNAARMAAGMDDGVGGFLPPALAMHREGSMGRSATEGEGGFKRHSSFSSLLVPSTPVRKGMQRVLSMGSMEASLRSPDSANPPPTFSQLHPEEDFAESETFVFSCSRAGGIDPDFVIDRHTVLDYADEIEHFAKGPTCQTDDEGKCECSDEHIMKDMRGFDYSKYQANDLFHSCKICGRRPATFLNVETFESVCASHVEMYYQQHNPPDRKNKHACSLFINILDIASSFDRIFWCERCHRFIWSKATEVYEPLTDQLAFSRGSYMKEPVLDLYATEFHTLFEQGKPGMRALGTATQGWRTTQEDAEVVFRVMIGKEPVSIFAVFDGHGGDAVARLARQHLEAFVGQEVAKLESDTKLPTDPDAPETAEFFKKLFTAALCTLDKMIEESEEGRNGHYNCVGCTACLVAVTDVLIVCANVGDSGAALYDKLTLFMLSKAHRITDQVEVDRIKKAGYTISEDGRIEGMLAVPRALGDFDFKQCGAVPQEQQAVSPAPDIMVVARPTHRGWGIIVACDGVWDTIEEDDVERHIQSCRPTRRHPARTTTSQGPVDSAEESPQVLNSALLNTALTITGHCISLTDDPSGNGMDNVSVLLVEPEDCNL